MEVKYNNKIIFYNDFLTPVQAKDKPDVVLQNIGYDNYTLIMYDPDAVKGTHWHWIVTNIRGNDFVSGVNLLEYHGPDPPDKKIHRYVFELYPINKRNSQERFLERNSSLQKGKEYLGLSGEPVLVFQFLSKKMVGGRKTFKRKKNNKYTKRKRH